MANMHTSSEGEPSLDCQVFHLDSNYFVDIHSSLSVDIGCNNSILKSDNRSSVICNSPINNMGKFRLYFERNAFQYHVTVFFLAFMLSAMCVPQR